MKLFRQTEKSWQAAFLATIALLMQGCAGQMLKQADASSVVADNEIIVVGSIDLTPGLGKEEQDLAPPGTFDLFGYGDMHRDRAIIRLNDKPEASDYSRFVINPVLGELFFFKMPAHLKYIVDGNIIVELGVSEILLPTGLKIDARPGEKAVYVGNLTYIRDDFNSIVDVRFTDDYDQARKEFRKRFGDKYTLTKALMKPL